MAVVDIQRRGQQIGRLRMGEKAGTGKTGKDGKEIMRPVRRDTWRLTTASRLEAEAIAARFGGEVREWNGEYEVATDTAEIPVTVPPRDEVVSQWYEKWTAGGNERRCTGLAQQDGTPCLCPHASDPGDQRELAAAALKRAEMAAMNPPQACKLVTRISLMIPDLPGLGVFRLDTGSYYAAVEIGDTARLLQVARDKGVFLPALLRIEQRKRVANGQTKKFPVPVLQVLATFRDLASGAIEQAGIAAQLPPAPGEARLAITGTPAAATGRQHREPVPVRRASADSKAQDIADRAILAVTRERIETLAAEAREQQVAADMVCTDRATDRWEELNEFLQDCWRVLPAGGEVTS